MSTPIKVKKNISRIISELITTLRLILAIKKISLKNLIYLALSIIEKVATTILEVSSVMLSVFYTSMIKSILRIGGSVS